MPISNVIAANRSWFDFSIKADGFDGLGVYAFAGTERVSTPYEFVIEFVSMDANLNLTSALGKECLLTVADKSGDKKFLHGVIRQIEQLHTGNKYTMYHAEVVPRLWFLTQTQDHRIYQKKSVQNIIQDILVEHHFVETSFDFKLRETYPEREYCVQYGESDFHFMNRICEEEGIYYYFEHKEDSHCLCFSDAEGGPLIPGQNDLRFYPGSGQPEDTAVISRARLRHRINSDKSVYREWNFTAPGIDLTGSEYELERDKAPVPVAMQLETYQFPHLYQVRDEGDRYTKLQLARQLTFRQWMECDSDVSRYLPGFTFTMHGHPRPDANRGWWITEVRHEGKQPGVLEHESPDGRGLEYKSIVTAIPNDTRFVPETKHKKVRIDGVQSAIVTGPSGEEAFVDEFGRVRVQFQWDREGKHDAGSSCWIRVADRLAGENFGFIQVPRIGQECAVEFMEGDPDRPVITGRFYNAAKMPPWELPKQKSLSGIQSREFKGKRRNQLVLDDSQGAIQAQLSSDHDLSQLNLGYITRINHVEGRKDFRGEGFELRTDGWGAVRGARGLYISTDARPEAKSYQKDVAEAAQTLNAAVEQHKNTTDQATQHKAQDKGDGDDAVRSARIQADAVRGSGKPQTELSDGHVVFSSPAGIALTTPQSTHIRTGENTVLTAQQHASVSAGKSFLVSALERVSLFASKGMKLFAGAGKVAIQAQSNDLDIIAEQVASIISTSKTIQISSPKEILISAGGSYLRVSKDGIEKGSNGPCVIHSKNKIMLGPNSKPWLHPTWTQANMDVGGQVKVRDELGRYVETERYAVHGSDDVNPDATQHGLQLFHEQGGANGKTKKFKWGETQRILSMGSITSLEKDMAEDAGDE